MKNFDGGAQKTNFQYPSGARLRDGGPLGLGRERYVGELQICDLKFQRTQATERTKGTKKGLVIRRRGGEITQSSTRVMVRKINGKF